MSLPRISPREERLDARKELLAGEKASTRQSDTLDAARRLPMVLVDTDYRSTAANATHRRS